MVRWTASLVPLFCLFWLPLYVSLAHTHVVLVALALLTITASWRVIVLRRNTLHTTSEQWTLNTILISHFSEKVRWCFDYCNVPYKEEVDIGTHPHICPSHSIMYNV